MKNKQLEPTDQLNPAEQRKQRVLAKLGKLYAALVQKSKQVRSLPSGDVKCRAARQAAEKLFMFEVENEVLNRNEFREYGEKHFPEGYELLDFYLRLEQLLDENYRELKWPNQPCFVPSA